MLRDFFIPRREWVSTGDGAAYATKIAAQTGRTGNVVENRLIYEKLISAS